VKKKGLHMTLAAALAAIAALTGGCAHLEGAAYVRGQSNVPSPLDDLDSTPASAPTAASAPAAAVDQRALDALNAMQTYIRSLRSFEVTADTVTDSVLDNGQNAALVRQVVIKVKQPDRMRAEITGDGNVIGMVYDGQRFSIFNQKHSDFARQDAPATLTELTPDLLDRRHIDVPFTDLRYWGFGPQGALAPTSARVIGVERIDMRQCTHYVYQKPGVDWELWIQKGPHPLPCKSMITVTAKPSRPRHESTYHWRVNPAFPASTFVFRPSRDMQEFPMPRTPRSPFGEFD